MLNWTWGVWVDFRTNSNLEIVFVLPYDKEKVGEFIAAFPTLLQDIEEAPKGPQITAIFDFDGTISVDDVGDALLIQGHAPDIDRVRTRRTLIVLDELGYVPFSKAGAELLFDFLRVHNYNGQQLMLNESVKDAAGMKGLPAGDTQPHWATYFAVTDCAAAEAMATELGGSVLRPASEIHEGRYAVLADPHGARFSVMEYRY